MKVIVVYLRIYADCLQRAVKGVAKNPWTLFLPVGLSVAFSFVAMPLVAALGPIGGFVIGFVIAAAASCYLYFLGGVVANSHVSVKEFGQSIRTYFWSVMNVMFVLSIASLISGALLPSLPQGGLLGALLWLAVVVLCNATPEVIYLRGTSGGLATLQRSIQFLQENWIEWALPNGVLLWALYVLRPSLFLGLDGLVRGLLFGAVLHVGMVFRGHLFEALDKSNHRQRMFRYRTGQ